MRKFSPISAALFSSVLIFSAGCQKGPQEGVVATVNGKPVLRADVDKVYANQLANNPQEQSPSPDQADSLRLNILHELILEEIVQQRAAKQNLTATDADVDSKIAEMKAPYTEEQFQAKLKASNQTLDDLKHEERRSLTLEKLLNKEINSRITVTDADVSTYYNAHKAEFNLIDNEYHLAQIIVSAGNANPANNLQNSQSNSAEDAKRKIQALKNRVDAGEDFGTLAMNFSENPETSTNGGDMGMVPETQLKKSPNVFAQISNLKAGQNTDIIAFPDQNDPKKVGGYAIFHLFEKAASGQRDLNDPRVQQTIRQQLHDSRSQLLKTAYLEMLRDQAKVENFLAEQVFKNAAK